MALNLSKSTGINLTKGSSISLIKEGKKLDEVTIGLNWGAIKKTGLFSVFSSGPEMVDLDGSVAVFEGKVLLDIIYYSKLLSKDGAVKHSGDDRAGDTGPEDDVDNETIHINLNRVNSRATSIFIFLNSYKKQDFQTIPYTKIRIYEGNPRFIKSVFATFNLTSDPAFHGKVSMIMGKLSKDNEEWKFDTIGEPIRATNIDETIEEIIQKFLG